MASAAKSRRAAIGAVGFEPRNSPSASAANISWVRSAGRNRKAIVLRASEADATST